MLGTKEYDILVPNALKIVRTSPPDQWFAKDVLTNTAMLVGSRKQYVPRKATGYSRDTVYIKVPRKLNFASICFPVSIESLMDS